MLDKKGKNQLQKGMCTQLPTDRGVPSPLDDMTHGTFIKRSDSNNEGLFPSNDERLQKVKFIKTITPENVSPF